MLGLRIFFVSDGIESVEERAKSIWLVGKEVGIVFPDCTEEDAIAYYVKHLKSSYPEKYGL